MNVFIGVVIGFAVGAAAGGYAMYMWGRSWKKKAMDAIDKAQERMGSV